MVPSQLLQSSTFAQESTLSIPELFLRILNELSAKELVVAALVCKAWTGLSLDTRYRYRPVALSPLLQRTEPERQRWTPYGAADLKNVSCLATHRYQSRSAHVIRLPLSQTTVPEVQDPGHNSISVTGLLPVLPVLEDLSLQVGRLWEVIINPVRSYLYHTLSFYLTLHKLSQLGDLSPSAYAHKIRCIEADLPLPGWDLLYKLLIRTSGQGSTGELLCPSLEKLDLHIGQELMWCPLQQTVVLLQGPVAQRGLLTVELKKCSNRFHLNYSRSKVLGEAIPNIR